MIPTLLQCVSRASCPEEMAREVAAAALAAYEAVAPGSPGREDPLAAFLASALTGGGAGETVSASYERAARQVDLAITALEHVRDQLNEHASTSACLPLPLRPFGIANRPLPAAA